MDTFISILTAVLTAYISFTNNLAADIEALLKPIESPVIEEFSLRQLPSKYENTPIILPASFSSQMAAVVGVQNEYTDSPKDSLVNIFCTHTEGDMIRATTGSGVIIDSDGVILTNAHVAQYFLLEGVLGDIDCYIRTGDPALPAYEAELLYISPAWVLENAAQIISRTPVGTGERDYALLYISSGLDNQPLPRSFPSLHFDATPFTPTTVPNEVVVSGYPAVSPFKQGGDGQLVRVSTSSVITELMTFTVNTPDVFSISGTPVGEQGSSGGPITTTDGKVIGLISTRGDDELFGTGSLRALTMSYIARTYQEETSVTLLEGMSGNLHERARRFHDALFPILQPLLVQELSVKSDH